MTIPTPRERADTHDPGLSPPIVIRRAGVSIRHLTRLVCEDTLAAIDALHDLARRCLQQTDGILAGLEQAIGEIAAGPIRQELIRLRRDIFNDRLPAGTLSAAAEARLAGSSGPEMARLRDWLSCRQERETLATMARETFAAERAAKHGRLPRMFRNREFRRGVALASPSLSEALDRYLRSPDGSAARRRHVERGLLRYYTRAAFKLSPFSTFTRVRLARWRDSEASGAGRRPRTHIHRHVTLNRTLIGHIAYAIARHPDLAGHVPVHRVRSLRHEGDTLVFVRHRYEGTSPNRVRVPRETVVRLKQTRAVAWVLSYLDTCRGPVSRRQLEEALINLLGDHDKAAACVETLVDVGVVIHRLPLPDESAPALADLIGFLQATRHDTAGVLQAELAALASCVDAYAASTTGARQRERLERIRAIVADIWSALGEDPTAWWDGLLVYEDCLEQPAVDVRCPPELAAGVRDLRTFLDLCAGLLDSNAAVRETIRHVLETDFGGGPVSLLAFAPRYHQRGIGPMARRSSSEAAYTPNPLALPRIEGLAALRREFGAVMTDSDGAETIDLGGVAARMHWPERLAALGVPRPIDGASYLETYAQPLSCRAGAALVVNKIQPGPCRALLRACSSLSSGADARAVANDVDQWLRSHRSGATACQLLATFDYNVNLTPRVTDKGLNYLGAPSREGRTVELGELLLSLSASGELVLTHRGNEADEPVVPVLFGMMASMFHLPLQSLLASLGTSEPILYRAFDPHAWVTDHDDQSAPVRRFPRLTRGACILRRRGWSVHREQLPLRAAGETDFDHFARVRGWQKQLGLPDEVFVRARGFKRRKPASGELPNPRYPTLHKPQYIHFGNDRLVDLFDQLLQESGERVYIEEALPDSRDWTAQQTMRPVELVIDSAVLDRGGPPRTDRAVAADDAARKPCHEESCR